MDESGSIRASYFLGQMESASFFLLIVARGKRCRSVAKNTFSERMRAGWQYGTLHSFDVSDCFASARKNWIM